MRHRAVSCGRCVFVPTVCARSATSGIGFFCSLLTSFLIFGLDKHGGMWYNALWKRKRCRRNPEVTRCAVLQPFLFYFFQWGLLCLMQNFAISIWGQARKTDANGATIVFLYIETTKTDMRFSFAGIAVMGFICTKRKFLRACRMISPLLNVPNRMTKVKTNRSIRFCRPRSSANRSGYSKRLLPSWSSPETDRQSLPAFHSQIHFSIPQVVFS